MQSILSLRARLRALERAAPLPHERDHHEVGDGLAISSVLWDGADDLPRHTFGEWQNLLRDVLRAHRNQRSA